MRHKIFKHNVFLTVALSILLSGCASLTPGPDRAVLRAKQKVAPALVHIRPVKEIYQGGKRSEIVVVGSGFIISPDGYVITNEHVAGQAQQVHCVLYDKEEVDAEVVGVDRYTDIALLKLKTDKKLPRVTLGNSRTIQSGQTVLALGSPHGLARSISKGIISVTNRYLATSAYISPYNNWIQTDAAINQGNSGGPLVNLKGEVIGINTRKLAGADNVGFAIPIDIAKEVIAKIKKYGYVPRSTIGISLQENSATAENPHPRGALIAYVDPNSSGASAGLQAGDILISINGKPVNAQFPEDLPRVRKIIADLPAGEKIPVQIKRGEQTHEISVDTLPLGEREGTEMALPEWGCTVSEVTASVARQAQLATRSGVLVTGVETGSIADRGHLLQGDIILGIDGEKVTNLACFQAAYHKRVVSKQPLIMLDVKRGALMLFALLEQDTEKSVSGEKK